MISSISSSSSLMIVLCCCVFNLWLFVDAYVMCLCCLFRWGSAGPAAAAADLAGFLPTSI